MKNTHHNNLGIHSTGRFCKFLQKIRILACASSFEVFTCLINKNNDSIRCFLLNSQFS